MARRAEATLWMLIKQGDKSRYVSVSNVGSGRYRPNIEGPFEPGPYYLRFTQDGKHKWECVGPELVLALNEQRNRQTALCRGVPEHIRSDNGPEFVAKELQKWLGSVGVGTLYIEPGSP